MKNAVAGININIPIQQPTRIVSKRTIFLLTLIFTMKVASITLLLATFCCASAFGLNGPAKTSVRKNVGISANHKSSMVQPIDMQGTRLSKNVVRNKAVVVQ
jgi:hypothetical protein